MAKITKEEAVRLGVKAEIIRTETDSLEELADRAEMSRQLLRYHVNQALKRLGLKKKGALQSQRTRASGTEEAHPDGAQKRGEFTSRPGPRRRASARKRHT